MQVLNQDGSLMEVLVAAQHNPWWYQRQRNISWLLGSFFVAQGVYRVIVDSPDGFAWFGWSSMLFGGLYLVTLIGSRRRDRRLLMHDVQMSASWPCPCCDYRTLSEAGAYDLCPVCFWEDDPHQTEQPDSSDGANGISLTEARLTYQRVGAMDSVLLPKVRAPTGEEVRERESRQRTS